jgi:AcrR family transcriptional regulator
VNSVKIKSRTGRPRAGSASGGGAGRRRAAYHHGDLRQQLLIAAEEIILERGVDGFTLREAARRAGVSPAAPAHHFKDARGLLTEVALLGFRDFGKALETADEAGGTDPTRRLQELARAYVRFALENPARFQLMFRHDKHDHSNEEFVSVAGHSYNVLERVIRAATNTLPDQELAPDSYGLLLAMWSLVHGFSHLALGGELNLRDVKTSEKSASEAKARIVDSLLPLLLNHLPKTPVTA